MEAAGFGAESGHPTAHVTETVAPSPNPSSGFLENLSGTRVYIIHQAIVSLQAEHCLAAVPRKAAPVEAPFSIQQWSSFP